VCSEISSHIAFLFASTDLYGGISISISISISSSSSSISISISLKTFFSSISMPQFIWDAINYLFSFYNGGS